MTNTPETRTFDLGTVLSITTGILMTDFDNVSKILDWMTGDQLFTHALPRAGYACEGPLLEQHPQLVGVTLPDDLPRTKEAIVEWLPEAAEEYGSEFEVAPLPPGVWASKDPISELIEMRGSADGIVVAVVGDEHAD